SGEAKGAISGVGGDDLGLSIDPADAVVVGIGDEQVSGRVQGKADGKGKRRLGGRTKLRGGRGTVVTGKAAAAVASGCGDDFGLSVDPADTVVAAIGDEQVSGRVQGEAFGIGKLRSGRGAIVSGEAVSAITGVGSDGPGLSVDPADTVVEEIGDQQVSGR